MSRSHVRVALILIAALASDGANASRRHRLRGAGESGGSKCRRSNTAHHLERNAKKVAAARLPRRPRWVWMIVAITDTSGNVLYQNGRTRDSRGTLVAPQKARSASSTSARRKRCEDAIAPGGVGVRF